MNLNLNDHLSMADLHTADPGAWPVIAGPDGAAPCWTGPVWWIKGQCFVHVHHEVYGGAYLCTRLDGTGSPVCPRGELLIRLDVSSVAARLSQMCAYALGLNGQDFILKRSSASYGGYTLISQGFYGKPYIAAWYIDGDPVRCYSDEDAPLPPKVATKTGFAGSVSEFLAALTITMASKIATLAGRKLKSQDPTQLLQQG